MMNRARILAFMLLCLVAVSCRYNEKELNDMTPSQKGDGRISFKVGTAKSVSASTKAGLRSVDSKMFLGISGGDSLFISSCVTDNCDPVPGIHTPAVKGVMVTEQNLSGFYVSALFPPTDATPSSKYIHLAYLDADDKADGIYTMDYYWPQQALDFFAMNFDPTATPVSLSQMQGKVPAAQWVTRSSNESYNSNSVSWTRPSLDFDYDVNKKPLGVFSYSLPEPDSVNKQDAINQPDYVFAITERMTRDSHDGVVPLHFAHCFAAVTVKLGDTYLDSTGRQVKEVKISGVPSSGECIITPIRGRGTVGFEWDTSYADRRSYSQRIEAEGSETNIPNGGVINDDEMTFMLIPHTLSEDAKITILFDLHKDSKEVYQHEDSVVVSIKDVTANDGVWYPGMKYIYTVSCEETVKVDVEDEFMSLDPLVIGNPAITNNGTAGVYVRACIVGWWEDTEGVVVAPWNETDGTFAGTGWNGATFTGAGSNWIKGEDGFFYFKNPVNPSMETEKLFDTYTLTADAPAADAKLILNVVTQAVLHYRVEEAWPLATSGVSLGGFRVSGEDSYW